ncbi:MAG: GDP-mannose 4,6-dehydratase [Clostridia bacterium]|nr:GDP-mannose 4,6-dehydratase [Clostridia bacterium]
MNKNIFITGVAGFLGSYIADRMIELGYEVVGVDNLSGGFIEKS